MVEKMANYHELHQLEEYVSLQEALVDAFVSQVGEFVCPCRTGIPLKGEIQALNADWEFTVHGAGILFSQKDRRRIVDIHDHFNRPDCFDVWRLSRYFGSFMWKGVRMVEFATGRDDCPFDEKVALWLEQLLQAGMIVVVEPGLYRLASAPSSTSFTEVAPS